LKEAVATARRQAGGKATVGIGIIAVIALFWGLDRPVAAARQGAICGATVSAVFVAVIAGLHLGADEAVATTRHSAVGQASVGVVGVAIVALLEAERDEAITTARWQADFEAAVAVVSVAVVALLAGLDHAVTAGGQPTLVGAVVALDGVAIVAGLHSDQQEAIAAESA
jgi:hypothetical protein